MYKTKDRRPVGRALKLPVAVAGYSSDGLPDSRQWRRRRLTGEHLTAESGFGGAAAGFWRFFLRSRQRCGRRNNVTAVLKRRGKPGPGRGPTGLAFSAMRSEVVADWYRAPHCPSSSRDETLKRHRRRRSINRQNLDVVRLPFTGASGRDAQLKTAIGARHEDLGNLYEMHALVDCDFSPSVTGISDCRRSCVEQSAYSFGISTYRDKVGRREEEQ